jgi:hypothetical protein
VAPWVRYGAAGRGGATRRSPGELRPLGARPEAACEPAPVTDPRAPEFPRGHRPGGHRPRISSSTGLGAARSSPSSCPSFRTTRLRSRVAITGLRTDPLRSRASFHPSIRSASGRSRPEPAACAYPLADRRGS